MSTAPTFIRHTAVWTASLVAVASGISWWAFGQDVALGIALGALVGFGNLLLLSRSLSKVLENPEQHRPAAGRKWVLPAVLLLKWPFLLLALGLILWYMPARPEGVAAGVALSLLAASIAAMRGATGTSDNNGSTS